MHHESSAAADDTECRVDMLGLQQQHRLQHGTEINIGIVEAVSTSCCLLQRQQRGPAGGCLRRTHPHCSANRGSCSTGTHLWAQCVPPTEAPACGGTCPQSTCRRTWAQLWLPGMEQPGSPASQPTASGHLQLWVGYLSLCRSQDTGSGV